MSGFSAGKSGLLPPRGYSFLRATAAAGISLALFACGAPDARQLSETALRTYQQALVARDVVQLRRVWRMSADDVREMREFFGSTQQLSVVLSAPRVTEEQGGIGLEFTQTLRTASEVMGPTAMRARLREEAGTWRLEEVRPFEERRSGIGTGIASREATTPPSEPEGPFSVVRVSAEGLGTPSNPEPFSAVTQPPASAQGAGDKGATVLGMAGSESEPAGSGVSAAQPTPPSRGPHAARPKVQAKPRPAATQPASNEDEDAALAALTEYQAAYERRDLTRLAEVWKMDPFEYELMQQIFRGNDNLRVSILEQGVATVGDQIAVDFDQAVARTSVKRARVSLRASLVRRPGGEWMILSIEPRDTPAAGGGGSMSAAGFTPSDSSESERKAVLAVLQEYERAFEAHDLDQLQRVWVLNPLERRSLQDLFSEPASGHIRVRVTSLVASEDKATVDFEQSFESSTGAEASQALAVESLRARLARAPDGSLVIVSISNRR